MFVMRCTWVTFGRSSLHFLQYQLYHEPYTSIAQLWIAINDTLKNSMNATRNYDWLQHGYPEGEGKNYAAQESFSIPGQDINVWTMCICITNKHSFIQRCESEWCECKIIISRIKFWQTSFARVFNNLKIGKLENSSLLCIANKDVWEILQNFVPANNETSFASLDTIVLMELTV